MSTLNVTSIKGRAGAIPNLPDGAIVSGIATIGAGGIDVTGIVTATSLESDTKISAGSSITATNFYGDGANLTNLPSQSPVVTGIASGTIPANRALCVHNDGKVGVVTGVKYDWKPLAQVGSAAGGMSNTGDMAFGNGKVFVIVKANPGNEGKCVAGTINADRTITWGAWTQFEASIDGSYCRVVYDSNADKFVISYNRSTAIKTRVATVSGTSITYGTETEVISANAESIEGCFDPDTNQVVWVYKTGTNIVYSRIGAVSGTSISYGTQVSVCGNNSNGAVGVTYDTTNNKVILASGYNGDQSNNGWAFIGTVSGTGYVGNAVASAGLINYYYQHSRINMLYDEERERIIFVAFNTNDSEWQSVVGTYASATSITWGVVDTIDAYTANTGNINSLAYDPYGKVYGFIYNNTSGDLVKYVRGTLNPLGSSEPNRMTWQDPVILSSNGYYVSVMNTTAGDNIVLGFGTKPSFYVNTIIDGLRNSTLSSDGSNFLGYSAGAYTNGQTVTVQVVGNVSTQVGLTPGLKYYIQGDGGIVSFKDPNISSYTDAGVALSATKLLIK
jgi:hypothetical protein